ncbi:MAG: arginase family protein [Mediterranea sp.]|jgi:arginase family enzyme|nr:arginase family protein [Mediterranea sp.]
MKAPIVVMNFTHVYEEERFGRDRSFEWIDCTDLRGTDCYCDEEALQTLRRRMAPYPAEGIHFIDSGNYHYLTKLWTDKIREPFSLIVFDHHPDMQPTLFGGMLSCGSWVKVMLDENPFLRKVCVVGVADKLVKAVPATYRERVRFYAETSLSHEESWQRFSHDHVDEPIYISIDKDVLDTASASTNWDQGSLSLADLEKLLEIILQKEKVIGVDVCGECTLSPNLLEDERDLAMDRLANKALLAQFL